MKKLLIALILFSPIAVFGLTVPWDRATSGVINPLYILDQVKANYFTATSTSQASTFPYASTTALSALSLCLTSDLPCRTTWPSGTLTQINTTYPVQGGPITTTGTISLAFGTTTTSTWVHQIFSSLFATNASSTNATTTSLYVTGLTSALSLFDADGQATEFTGSSCTNQFARALSAAGVITCATVTSTDIDSSIVPSARTLTVAGTANQITSSAGAQDLSANRTWTLAIANPFTFPGNATSTLFSANYASSTKWYGGGLLTDCNSNNVLTWTASTGQFGCEADDSGSTFPFTPATNYSTSSVSTSTPPWFRGSLYSGFASSTFVFTNATATQVTIGGSTWITPLTSALILTDGAGLLAEYAGTSCTNQFPQAVSALGAWTCDSVVLTTDVSGTLPVANGGTGLSTFGGTNTILYTTAADTLSSNASFVFNPSLLAAGIGTSTPRWTLQLASSTAPQLALSDASATGMQWTMRSAGGFLYFSTTTASTFATSTPAGITINGNAGTSGLYVGTSTPGATGLAVNGTVFLHNLTSATGGTNEPLCITATPNQVIEETTTVCAVSSREFKHDIVPLDLNALKMVSDLNPVIYSYNDDMASDYQDRKFGFIAEEVAEIDPHLAEYGLKGEARNLDDRGIMAVLVKAFKEMIGWNGTQDERISALEKENVELKARIDALEKKL